MKTGRPTDRIAEATPESRRFPANMSFNGKDDYRTQAESLPSPEAGASRHGRLQLLELIDQLGERDFEILLSLKSAKYLLTGQVKRLHLRMLHQIPQQCEQRFGLCGSWNVMDWSRLSSVGLEDSEPDQDHWSGA